MWIYEQKSGTLFHNKQIMARGYSGSGIGRNNPEFQDVHNVGPIPVGDYTISGPPRDTEFHGPYVLGLIPNANNYMFDRSNFLIHGDNSTGTASEGCIIMPHGARTQIWMSKDYELQVIKSI